MRICEVMSMYIILLTKMELNSKKKYKVAYLYKSRFMVNNFDSGTSIHIGIHVDVLVY